MRGLHRLTGLANTLQAWEDWEKIASRAVDRGWDEYQINRFAPRPQDGWRKIDKCISRLRDALERDSQPIVD